MIFAGGFIATQMIVGVIAAIVLVIYLIATGQLKDLNDPNVLLEQIQGSIVLLTAIAAVPLTGLLLGLCLICRRYVDRRPMASMGLVRPARSMIDGIVPGFFFGLAPIVIASIVLYFIGGFQLEGFSVSIETLVMVPVFMLMAFQEEIVFRGYLLQNLIDIHRNRFGIVFTSIVFWLVHGMNPAAWSSPVVSVNLIGAGVVLGLAYQFSRNIWFPTALHFGWNFGQGVLLSIPVSGITLDGILRLKRNETMPNWLTGGEFGLEGSIVITALEVGMIVLLFCGLRSQQHEAAARPIQTEVDDVGSTDDHPIEITF